jgi:hypothetical protein
MDAKGFEESEIAEELLAIRVQKAYLTQRLGDTDAAVAEYQAILKDKPSDATITAVVGNNLAVAQ